jgi:hypothetical protein
MEELFEFSPEIPLERGLLELQEHLVAEVRQ